MNRQQRFHEHISITDNYIEGPPGNGIWFDGRARRLNISRNRIVNPAEAVHGGPPGRAGISFMIRGYDQAELDRLAAAGFAPLVEADNWTVDGNVITDTRPNRFLGFGIYLSTGTASYTITNTTILDNQVGAVDGSAIQPYFNTGGRTGNPAVRVRVPVSFSPVGAQTNARFGSTWIDEAAGHIWVQTAAPHGGTWQQIVIP